MSKQGLVSMRERLEAKLATARCRVGECVHGLETAKLEGDADEIAQWEEVTEMWRNVKAGIEGMLEDSGMVLEWLATPKTEE